MVNGMDCGYYLLDDEQESQALLISAAAHRASAGSSHRVVASVERGNTSQGIASDPPSPARSVLALTS